MKAREVVYLLLVLSWIFIIPSSTATISEWEYSNYLNSLKIESYDDPTIAGQSNQITIEIGSNIDVFLYVEFKGEFSWGNWIFGSCEIQV